MSSIKQAAETFTLSYAAAMSSGSHPTTTRASCAKALSSHYGPGMTAFTLGTSLTLRANDEGAAQVEQHLSLFEATGIGYDIVMVEHEVDVVGENYALCPITWEIKPRQESGVEGWRWRNVYGFRRGTGGEGWWEMSISDNEITELMKRCPSFFAGAVNSE